ncbi:MAG: hypothetical protein IPP55_17070 [Anaerolineales bacterium]|nr:hypothetical protein [Anaerolineales bacterium]
MSDLKAFPYRPKIHQTCIIVPCHKNLPSLLFPRSVLLALLAAQLRPAETVKAHPADIYAHTITVTLSQTEMQIKWQLAGTVTRQLHLE